jgi:hypothetical protein
MYSFLFDQTYINLLILIVIVSLVMFLWRKLIILEGNFFILEKRVNIIKKDFREDSIAKNIEASENIMNEIFKECPAINACKQFECFPPNVEFPKNGKNNSNNLSINEDMVQYISIHTSGNIDDEHNAGVTEVTGVTDVTEVTEVTGVTDVTDTDVISFNNEKKINDDIDNMVNNVIGSSEESEVKGKTDNEHNDQLEPDNVSVSSEITFTSDDKKKKKKK